MKTLFTILSISCLIFPFKGFSQGTFQKIFGGSDMEGVFTSCPTSDGGVYMAGYVGEFGSQEALVIRLDSSGDVKWSKKYNSGNDDDALTSIKKTFDGGFIGCGRTGSGFGTEEILLVRGDTSGSIVWSKTLGSSGNDIGNVYINSDGSFLIVRKNNTTPSDLFLHRTDANGNLIWSKKVSVPSDIQFGGMGTTSDGSFLICINDMFTYDVFLIKLAASGSVLWAKKYGPPADPLMVFQTTVTSDDGCLLSGWMNSNYVALRMSPTGNLMWSKEYGGPGATYMFSMDLTSNGNFVGTGSYTFTTNSLLVFSFDQSGDTLFSHSFGRSGVTEQGKSVIESGYGGFFVTASEKYDTTSDFNIFLAKTDAEGRTACNDVPALISHLGTVSLQVASFQPTITTGTISISIIPMTVGTGISETLICSSIGINELSYDAGIEIYPNPSSGIFHISFSKKNQYEKLIILNLLGEVVLLQDVRLKQSLALDLSDQTAGVYFIRFENKENYQTIRVCLTN